PIRGTLPCRPRRNSCGRLALPTSRCWWASRKVRKAGARPRKPLFLACAGDVNLAAELARDRPHQRRILDPPLERGGPNQRRGGMGERRERHEGVEKRLGLRAECIFVAGLTDPEVKHCKTAFAAHSYQLEQQQLSGAFAGEFVADDRVQHGAKTAAADQPAI